MNDVKSLNSMNTKVYPYAKRVAVCGDIHGDFKALVNKACIQQKMTDTLIIVAGDCGFGFYKLNYYKTMYNKLVGSFRKSNNWIIFVRGNHDDPSYFLEEKINYEHFRCVPDYTVVQACRLNILCVGGAVSMCRSSCLNDDATFSYWEAEMPVFDEEKIREITGSCRIDTVVSHTAPSFCPLLDNKGLADWAVYDDKLTEDCRVERETMDRIYYSLKENGHHVDKWFYGHFHRTWFSKYEDTNFRMINILEFQILSTSNA